MIFMLKRHHLLSKRNSQKQQIEKHLNIIKASFEVALKSKNRKSENDFLDLKDLKADLRFEVPDDVKPILTHFKKMVTEFVSLNNRYVDAKISEEKAKAKKPKLNDDKLEAQLAQKYEKITYEQEMGRLVKELSKGLAEDVAPVFERKYLNRIFGLGKTQNPNPTLGKVWNQIIVWPKTLTTSQKRTPSAG